MESNLAAATRRAEAAEDEVNDLRKRVAALQSDLDAAREELNGLRRELHAAIRAKVSPGYECRPCSSADGFGRTG